MFFRACATVTIVGDIVTVNQPYAAPDPNPNAYNGFYDEITISGSVVTFGNSDVTGTFTTDGGYITLTTFGLMNTNDSKNKHIYILQ